MHTIPLSPSAPPPGKHLSLLANNGAGNELFHDLIGASVDGLNTGVHKCPGETERLVQQLVDGLENKQRGIPPSHPVTLT